MRQDLTDLTMIVDKSGSMSSVQRDSEEGINRLIQEQKLKPGDCNFSLVEFDSKYNFVYDGVPIQRVCKYHMRPDGFTALLDAVGNAIVKVGSRLCDMRPEDRPGLVVFVIVTDGEENKSREFRRDQIKQMIEHQRSVYNWQFIFLGANQDAFAEAGSIGISASSVANYSQNKTAETFCVASGSVSSLRHALADGFTVAASFSDEDRNRIA